MKNSVLTLILTLAGLWLFYMWQGLGAARTMEEITALETQLLESRCTKPELVNRSLLQQTWFYDQSFTQLAGAFDQHGFSFFGWDGPAEDSVEGVFCIDGRDLLVQYVDRKLVPTSVSISEMSIKFGTKLTPMSKDTFVIRELTTDRMILTFASDGKDHVFYRKN